MIKAVIFDMDGLLIDSEHFWQETERKVFGELGITISSDMQKYTFGLRSDMQIRYWHEKFPWKDLNHEDVEKRYNTIMLEYFNKELTLMKGAEFALDFFSNKGLPLALASSSNMELIEAFLHRFGFEDRFEIIYSAEFEEFGKPHPAVFLETAKRLNMEPVNCLVLEDSFHGMIAAKAAMMKTIVVPTHTDDRFIASDIILESLDILNEDIFTQLND